MRSLPTLPIVYGVYREVGGPVFGSQVLAPLAWLAEQGHDTYLVALAPLGNFIRPSGRRAFGQLRQSVADPLDAQSAWLPASPSRLRCPTYDAALLAAFLRFRFRNRPFIFHCRGAGMTALALRVRRHQSDFRIVFDCRGIAYAEYLYERRSIGRSETELARSAKNLLEMEKRCARQADSILCVSNAMAGYLVREFGVDREKITVVPCSVDAQKFASGASEREAVRRELRIDGRFVLTYCGSMHAWQLPEMGFRLFRLIQRLAPEAHYLILTTQPERMKALAARHGLGTEEATVVRVPHEEVPRYLAAGDVGLLLRERSLVNEVASPVKFAEYLAAGLPVILTEGIGDFSELVRLRSLGMVFEEKATDDEVASQLCEFIGRYNTDPGALRESCLKAAHNYLSHQQNYPALSRAYQRLSA
jgi:glycosyltransferase involved in cell wall biosynthesis